MLSKVCQSAHVIVAPNRVIIGNFDQSAIDAFRSNPNVEYVSENGIMSAFDTQYVESSSSIKSLRSNTSVRNNAPWNLARISTRDKLVKQNPFALDFQYNYKGSTPGKDVDIYVVDTGLLFFVCSLHESISPSTLLGILITHVRQPSSGWLPMILTFYSRIWCPVPHGEVLSAINVK